MIDIFLQAIHPIVFIVLFSVGICVAAAVEALVLQFVAERREGPGPAYTLPGWVKFFLPLLVTATAAGGLFWLRPIWQEPLEFWVNVTFWLLLCAGLFLSLLVAAGVTYWKDHWKPGKVVALGILGIFVLGVVFTETIDDRPVSGNPQPFEITGSRVAIPKVAKGVEIEVKPWREAVKVGEIVPLGVTVKNSSGINISDLTIQPVQVSESVIVDWQSRSLGNLQDTATWGPELFEAQLLKPGDQEVEFRLSYVDGPTQSPRQVTQRWTGTVGGPSLEVQRYIYSGPVVTSGQVIDVRLLIQNVGEGPVYRLQMEPHLMEFFQSSTTLRWPDILEPGEEFHASYTARADRAGEGPLEDPNADFFDGANNRYDTKNEPDNVPLEVQNYLCPRPNRCQESERMEVVIPNPGSTPQPASSAPPILEIKHSSKQGQFVPGSHQDHHLIVQHDGEEELYASVQIVEDAGLKIEGFVNTFRLAPGKQELLSGTVIVPGDMPLGKYHPALTVQLIDASERLLGKPHEVRLSFEVTLIRITRNVTRNELNQGEDVRIETNLTNVSNQVVTVRWEEQFSGSGISVQNEVMGPAGKGRGSQGNYYFVTFNIDPGKVEKRVFDARADEVGAHLLESIVTYEMADGNGGSASLTTTINVNPAPEGEVDGGKR